MTSSAARRRRPSQAYARRRRPRRLAGRSGAARRAARTRSHPRRLARGAARRLARPAVRQRRAGRRAACTCGAASAAARPSWSTCSTPALPIREKRRTHFHRFMREVHERLRAHAGERDPLAAIAREWRDATARAGAGRILRQRHRRRDAAGAPARAPVRRRRGAGDQLQRRTGRAVQGRPAARALPAGDRTRSKQHCAVVHLDSPAGLPAARTHPLAGVPAAAGRRVGRLAADALA